MPSTLIAQIGGNVIKMEDAEEYWFGFALRNAGSRSARHCIKQFHRPRRAASPTILNWNSSPLTRGSLAAVGWDAVRMKRKRTSHRSAAGG